MPESFSSKLALRAIALSVLLCLALFALFARTNAAGTGEPVPGPTVPLVVETAAGRFDYAVEVAATGQARERGLMHRRVLADDHGMLFDMGKTAPATFWMHDTPLSLDIIFIDAGGRVASIAADAEPLSDTMIGSGVPVRFVLELGAGQAARMRLAIGDRVRAAVIDALAGG